MDFEIDENVLWTIVNKLSVNNGLQQYLSICDYL